jgi:glycosyltransferase involved in cell wall biosynthesis
MNKPVFVISCPFDTYSGYGARSRDLVKSIIELDKYAVKLLPQRWGSTSWGFCKDHPEWEFLYQYAIQPNQITQKPEIWMQITIPNEFQPQGKFNIGCTAGIEATACKPEWIEGLNRMDVNWVSSSFAKGMFESVNFERRNKQTNQVASVLKLEKPIEVVLEGANLDVYKPISSKEINTFNFEEIKESFCYLNVGHWMQGDFGHDRKNLGLLVKSFLETFKGPKTPKPALILKASQGVASYMSRESILDKINSIKSTVNSSSLPNIYLINGEFTDSEMNELYNHPKVKAMISLTKGEGYGRPLLEFSLTGKPVIASGWSGHLDFLKPDMSTLLNGALENIHPSAVNNWLIPEAQWFKVDEASVGRHLKDCFRKYKQYSANSKKQKNYSKTQFSYEQMKNRIDNILDSYVPEFPRQVELNLPGMDLPKLQKVE